jgi:hypothetical protein
MNTNPIRLDGFETGGRGPALTRWLHDEVLYFPNSDVLTTGAIVGAEYEDNWIIFDGLQITQIVPEEVHSYWHRELTTSEVQITGMWEVENSVWLKTFNQCHLTNHKHFVIEFYDEIVEIICKALVSGKGVFNIQHVAPSDCRFAYAYLHYAMAQRKSGNTEEALTNYQRYLEHCPNGTSAEYAKGCIQFILTGSVNHRR